jgi:hypothetical protein
MKMNRERQRKSLKIKNKKSSKVLPHIWISIVDEMQNALGLDNQRFIFFFFFFFFFFVCVWLVIYLEIQNAQTIMDALREPFHLGRDRIGGHLTIYMMSMFSRFFKN